MSSAKHTPGPWRVWRDQDPKEPVQICGMESDFVCEISGINTNREANASLIAAAPELLEALDGFLELCGQGVFQVDNCDQGDVIRWTEKARAAIAKAKGGQS
jgi:hypothetical protein